MVSPVFYCRRAFSKKILPSFLNDGIVSSRNYLI